MCVYAVEMLCQIKSSMGLPACQDNWRAVYLTLCFYSMHFRFVLTSIVQDNELPEHLSHANNKHIFIFHFTYILIDVEL